MTNCNCEEENFIKILAEKVHLKKNVSNGTQLPVMCTIPDKTHPSTEIDVCTDVYRWT